MSAALEQSLDAIIASNKPKRSTIQRSKKVGKGAASRPTRVGKRVAPARRAGKPVVKKQQVAKIAAAVSAAADPLSYSTKVLVHGLPKDIRENSIKEFFQSTSGAVSKVSLTYNSRGASEGIATVIFKNTAGAKRAVEKYNGAPIDGSKARLKIETIIDPSQKPLAARIKANAPEKKLSVKPNNVKKPAPRPLKKAIRQQKKKTAAPKKKTIAELDAEMEDYFNSSK